MREILTKLVSLSSKKDMIKIETDPERRLRPIDADLQLPDTSKFQITQLTWGGD